MNTQFWAGNFKSEKTFNDFFQETYTNNDENPISKFAVSQNETWIDHDFLEVGFNNERKNLRDKFIQYSYSEKWINIFEELLKGKSINNINAIIMVSYDGEYKQIKHPVSYQEENLKIEYLGVINY